ncbi:beta-galactosidase [Pontiella sulfatireligans]|uniref:Glycoside hydrolase family 42 N-terminal domain-containing protein n=1 Tax=Pontiella sulfatireligans TaxID=2750658 RepID=A0A6C2UJN5_9BACT|nr:beta-galactosidase [Pontiella sulfatireligans]VGO20442.1 hypothetical protein SCARR_02505 [Pontiella sulfatireligans]
MKGFKCGRRWLLRVVVGCAFFAANAFADMEWKHLTQQVEARQTALASMIREAQRKNVCTDYAETSYHVIGIFQQAAQHDHDHMGKVRSIFQSFNHYKKIDPVHTERLPVTELEACVDIADNAMAELRLQLAHQIKLTIPPDFTQGQMNLGKGAYQLDGRPVFPSTLVWTPKTEPYLNAFGYLGGGYLQISQLEQDGTPSERTLQRSIERTKEQAGLNTAPIVFLMGHTPGRWQREQHPEILHGGRNFTQYDIDSPLVRGWIKDMCEGMLPELSKACSSQPMMHLVANEPHFATAKGSWKASNGLSDITIKKFQRWLESKYKTIGALNTVYGSSHAGWDQVLFHDLPVEKRQIDKKLRGTPVWYDWNRFNQERVSDWFTYLKEQSQANDNGRKAPMSIKMLGFTLSRNTRDGGMDLEYLTKLQDVVGADLRVAPRGSEFYGKHEEGMDPETGWQAHYAYDWSEQSMYLDFSKSLCPDKVFYDSEWHGFGAVSWRNFNLSREYVRSSLWLAFTHGMGMIKPWLWGRGEDGALSPKADHIGELATQPIAVDAFGRTMKELNAHAEHIVASVPTRRDFLIYYCEESAIQDENYTSAFKDVYEALKLLNLNVGFTTPTEIANLDPETQTVIVPPTPYVLDASLDSLSSFTGSVVMVGSEQSFLKTELGAAQSGEGVRAPFASLPMGNAMELADAFEPALASIAPALPLGIKITDPAGKKAHGVMINQAIDPTTGKLILVLNNISKDPRVVLIPPEMKVANLIKHREEQNRIELNPCDVRLLLVADAH